ncbi:cupin domain-containing protein [Alginatibacterium sediminis]|uniref:Cupin domain-containing protein n=1 Tax=Alginatibacterium sediminis TaxID=2164068 RepID=A0A420EBM2_9ALTE|nr:cupin domain-containing protein [Alginatibacterium sediminis]RKF18089.1 cupin domain-containing protein [Alginatibacterium sediminis]
MSVFFLQDQTPWTELGDGIRRKIIATTNEMMVVYVHFDKGAVGTPHTHEIHDQVGYVAAGSFEAMIDGEKKVLQVGDAYIARKLVEHGAVALEQDSVLIDIFNPPREDFLS